MFTRKISGRRSGALDIVILVNLVIFAFVILVKQKQVAYAGENDFDFPESIVQASPAEPKALKLTAGESVVDFDIARDRPEVAIILKTSDGKQSIVFWNITEGEQIQSRKTLIVPTDIKLSAIAWHPLGKTLFFLTSTVGKQEILKSNADAWNPVAIYKSNAQLRRLVVGPLPFRAGEKNTGNIYNSSYRVYFGIKKSDGNFKTHTVTENGGREYAILDSVPHKINYGEDDNQSDILIDKSALPLGFHPGGYVLIWENEKKCFQKAIYGGNNWTRMEPFLKSKSICNGSLTYTPNGIAAIHWVAGTGGAELIYDSAATIEKVAAELTFTSTPSSVPDGKGIVGVVKTGDELSLQYVPISVPLADVANAWMFLESPKDRELFIKDFGLFRPTNYNQLHEIYNSENHNGGRRPYLITTDIFWELYASAFEGIFMLHERQAAVPHFWNFVQLAHEDLKIKAPDSKMTKAFAAVLELRSNSKIENAEAKKYQPQMGFWFPQSPMKVLILEHLSQIIITQMILFYKVIFVLLNT